METLIVSAILLLALILFLTELIPIDTTALLVTVLLIVTQVLTPTEGLSGFSNPAPITVAAMLVLSAGLIRTGAVAKLGQKVSTLGGSSEVTLLAVIFPVVAFLSAFISNTAAVAMFLPIVLNIAREKQLSPSKLLLPLSYAAIVGGAVPTLEPLPTSSWERFTPSETILPSRCSNSADWDWFCSHWQPSTCSRLDNGICPIAPRKPA